MSILIIDCWSEQLLLDINHCLLSTKFLAHFNSQFALQLLSDVDNIMLSFLQHWNQCWILHAFILISQVFSLSDYYLQFKILLHEDLLCINQMLKMLLINLSAHSNHCLCKLMIWLEITYNFLHVDMKLWLIMIDKNTATHMCHNHILLCITDSF